MAARSGSLTQSGKPLEPWLNRIYRLYREKGPMVRQRRAQRRAIGTRVPILVEASGHRLTDESVLGFPLLLDRAIQDHAHRDQIRRIAA